MISKITYLCLLSFFFFLAGCATATNTLGKRDVAQASAPAQPRQMIDQPLCQFEHPVLKAEGMTSFKISALSGFMVGPQASLLPKNPESPTLRPFFTDGCSMSPNGVPLSKDKSEVWVDCCIKHDTKYWLGGPESDKNSADNFLAQCMGEKGYPDIGKVYEFFVQKYGGPDTIKTYRWGYGWNYKRPYAEITPQEEEQVRILYGVGKQDIQQVLFDANTPIVHMCETNDPVFVGFSQDEKMAYGMLNARIKRNAVIDWAHWGNSTEETRELDVQLQDCSAPLKFIFYKNSNQGPQISGNCE